MGHSVAGPLGGDQLRHAHFVASLTHRTTDRSSHITPHAAGRSQSATLRDDSWRVSEHTVAASTARQQLSARPKRRTNRASGRPGPAAAPRNLLRQDFAIAAPNEK